MQLSTSPSKVTAPARPKGGFHAPAEGATTRIDRIHLGELDRMEEQCLWIVAAGKPETQGSMRIKNGVVAHSKGPALHAWRDTITKEALRVTQGRWEALNIPVRLDVVLTVPAPKTLPSHGCFVADEGTPRIPPMSPPDVDKLLRGVQDALSPNDKRKKGEEVKIRDRRFKLLTDDSRIVDSSVRKTYPRPRHTHPWALQRPGAVIRVAPLGADVEPLPASTLSTPDQMPEPARLLESRLR